MCYIIHRADSNKVIVCGDVLHRMDSNEVIVCRDVLHRADSIEVKVGGQPMPIIQQLYITFYRYQN